MKFKTFVTVVDREKTQILRNDIVRSDTVGEKHAREIALWKILDELPSGKHYLEIFTAPDLDTQ